MAVSSLVLIQHPTMKFRKNMLASPKEELRASSSEIQDSAVRL